MRAIGTDENICNDKWLSALVDAMDEVEALRADDICRSADVPAGLMAQLRGSAPTTGRFHRLTPAYFELA